MGWADFDGVSINGRLMFIASEVECPRSEFGADASLVRELEQIVDSIQFE